MRMNCLYVHNMELGYGRMGVKLVEAVERLGVDVFDDLPNPQQSGAQKFIPHTNGKSAVCGHVSWLSTPGHCRGYWKGQTTSLLTMWESNLLPEPFRESLDTFDTLIVPSQQNKELFSRYHNNVIYVPLGIDPLEWYPIPRPGLDQGGFFNYFISGGGTRKGSDLVIKAFEKIFGGGFDGPEPRLFIHTAKARDFPRNDRIHLITGKFTPEEERAFYAMAHCYVQPSRGEGFGMRPLQAIAQGCPTIATNAHGHAAFGDLITYPLRSRLQRTPENSFHHGPAGSWWEPNFDELCEAMSDVYTNYAVALGKARTHAQVAVKQFTWDETARRYIQAIGIENLILPDVVPKKWLEPEVRRYLVRVNKQHALEVAGIQYMFEPGRDYYEPADVKRVLYDAGHLDPACLPQNMLVNQDTGHGPDLPMIELESGLTAEQLKHQGDYTAANSVCPTCHQRLNTNVATLEELEALPMPRELY